MSPLPGDPHLAAHRVALLEALRVSLATIGAAAFARELNEDPNVGRNIDEAALAALVERLLPTDPLAARRRAAEHSGRGDAAYTDRVLEPGLLFDEVRALLVRWGMTDQRVKEILEPAPETGLISKHTRNLCLQLRSIGVLMVFLKHKDPQIAATIMTTEHPKLRMAPIAYLYSSNIKRARAVYDIVYRQVYGREP